MPSPTVTTVADALQQAGHTVVLTGAGMSAPSGVPTFRGADGLWRSYRPEDLATPDAFARDPSMVWAWYDMRRQRIAACAPNAGHHVLARWSRERGDVCVVTQNVDGLHEQAGTRNVLRLHGSIWHVRCAHSCPEGGSREMRQSPLPHLPPRCTCGALLRPDVVWFGESLDPAVVDAAERAVARADVLLAIGTSAQVYPAAGLIPIARAAGALVVEINPDPAAPAGLVDVRIAMSADRALEAIDAELRN